MRLGSVALIFLCNWFCSTGSFVINPVPISIIDTPDSILKRKSDYKTVAVGARKRYSTCTSAGWFHRDYLMLLDYLGERLRIYNFNEKSEKFTLIQSIFGEKSGIKQPEHLVISSDEKLVAIANTTVPGVTIYGLDLQNHLITPEPIFKLDASHLVHNVRFSSDGGYLAYATFDAERPYHNYDSVYIYKVTNDVNNFNLTRVYRGNKPKKFFRLKAINFTQNNQYAILAYSLSFPAAKHKPFEHELVAHKFNSDGTLGEIVSSVKGDSSTEDIVFLHDDTEILMSDHSADRLLIYPFDPKTGQIGTSFQVIQNPEAQLSFPHGMSVSHDEKYLAVVNYGPDACNIYRIE